MVVSKNQRIYQAAGVVNLTTCGSSKSLSNRLVPFVLFSQTNMLQLKPILVSEDVDVMRSISNQLGCTNVLVRKSIQVYNNSVKSKWNELYFANSGTSARFMMAVLAFLSGCFCMFGLPRLHSRPIDHLVQSLRSMGGRVKLTNSHFLPAIISPPSLVFDDDVVVLNGEVSSQFVTAMMYATAVLVSSKAKRVAIQVEDVLVSKPYVDMTLKLMERLGVCIDRIDWNWFCVQSVKFLPTDKQMIDVEIDMTAVSYIIALCATRGGCVKIQNIPLFSIQGDMFLLSVFSRCGLNILASNRSWLWLGWGGLFKPLNLVCSMIPDAVMALLVVVACYVRTSNMFYELLTWRFKETDRMLAMAIEIRKFGVVIECGLNFVRLNCIELCYKRQSISSYNDHRIAMSYAVSRCCRSLCVRNAKCVNKTFPDFFYTINGLVAATELAMGTTKTAI